ncbi:hypothetical protein FPOAC1_011475 [Fusarium poae]|uniref:hypothetical protein n=1 Tax=Fusarium poae TaxID=36050 RepID=UPI001CE95433|nr:hypothetical protein FPOAC1_011475 [Fusarium poae]KAG8666665.1 hypothetical protein FPOAC1_011475 [Fusarium poae]
MIQPSSDTLYISLAEAPLLPPPCFQCNSPSRRYVTRSSNLNGNASRPYYKCIKCPKFLCFADQRGNVTNNPPCQCGKSSKFQVAGWTNRQPGGLHLVCRMGACGYYSSVVDQNGEQKVLSREEMNLWMSVGRV